METYQMIILSILGILYLITLAKLYMTCDDSKVQPAGLYMMINGILVGFIFLLAVIMSVNFNKTKKQLKGKCPEYQMIDSVYILKR